MIKVNDKYFELVVIRKNIKNIYLRIKGDTLEVTCPKWLSKKEILNFIESKANWIANREDKHKDSKLIVDDYIYYLGKKYRLYILQGRSRVVVTDDTILIYANNPDIDNALKVFYKEGKKVLFNLIVQKQDKYLNVINDYGYYLKPEYKFRIMKSAWGINYPKKNLITINEKLIHFDDKCLEAVLWHEILHFVIPNHSKRFHEVLNLHMPNYETLIKSIY